MQRCCCLLSLVFALAWPMTMRAGERVVHTDPLNRKPEVRAAYERFYTLDYDGALNRFRKVEHPSQSKCGPEGSVRNCSSHMFDAHPGQRHDPSEDCRSTR
jgi:hypothetical protein